MRWVANLAESDEYDFFGDNCQDWAQRVRDLYKTLEQMPHVPQFPEQQP